MTYPSRWTATGDLEWVWQPLLPALDLIDATGQVRDHHYGEGNYEESEMGIRRLLAASATAARSTMTRCRWSRRGQRCSRLGELKDAQDVPRRWQSGVFASPGGKR